MAKKGKKYFTRDEAIGILEELQKDADCEPHDLRNFAAMSNEELGEELCLCGHVHDEDFGGVTS